jgi:hypothetical protein
MSGYICWCVLYGSMYLQRLIIIYIYMKYAYILKYSGLMNKANTRGMRVGELHLVHSCFGQSYLSCFFHKTYVIVLQTFGANWRMFIYECHATIITWFNLTLILYIKILLVAVLHYVDNWTWPYDPFLTAAAWTVSFR